MHEAPAPLTTGDHIGPYRIEALLGRGGMGAVYLATDAELGRKVAVKTISAWLRESPEAVARFKKEAQAASQVSHDNVVQIYSFGVDRGTPYIVMEHLKGESLAARLGRGSLTPTETADLLLPVISGVWAAHRQGFIHRDLKPANVFLAEKFTGTTPMVLDFGLSRLISEAGTRLTASGMVMGTELYMAPEQLEGGADLDHRVDQYALGVVAYECLTGKTPHEGKTRYQLARDLMEGRFAPPRALAANVPEALEKVVLRALATQPAGRYPSLRAFAQALLPFASPAARSRWTDHFTQAGTEALPVLNATVPLPGQATRVLPGSTRPLEAPEPSPATPALRRRSPLPWLAAALLVLLLGALAWHNLAGSGPNLEAASPPASAPPVEALAPPPAPRAVTPEERAPEVEAKPELPAPPPEKAARPSKSRKKKKDIYYTPEGVPVI